MVSFQYVPTNGIMARRSATRTAILVMTLVLACAWLVEPALSATFELNCLELGKPATREQIKSTIGLSCTQECESVRGCNASCGSGSTLIAGVPAWTMIKLDSSHTVLTITATFETTAFDVVSAAFEARYGSPARVDHSVITTDSGRQIDQTVNIWLNEVGDEIRVARFISDVKFGSIVLRTVGQIYQGTK
jgi:hypothetical protein